MSNANLKIDPNTLNGFGIITINLSTNYVDKNATQYIDLNTDYFIYQGTCDNKTSYFVSNYKIDQKQFPFIYKLHGPFTTSTEAINKLDDLGFTSNRIDNKYLKYNKTTNKIEIINTTTYTDLDFDFFALTIASN